MPEGRNLLICIDGTGNKPESQSISNVVRIAMAAMPVTTDGREQIIHYQRGVGSSYKLDGLLGGTSGAGIRAAVISAYTFLVTNYRPGDRIFIFGFSRGAFIARILCGLVDYSGIVRTDGFSGFRLAIAHYFEKHPLPADSPEMVEFRATSCHPERRIDYVGLFDAVGGWMAPNWLSGAPHGYENDALGSAVANARHALSIDERRIFFVPTVWTKLDTPPPGQTVEQVWFPGVHSDIGGSSPSLGLGNDALQWIVAGATTAGAEFNPKMIPEVKLVLGEQTVRRWFRTGYGFKTFAKFFFVQLGWTLLGTVLRPYALLRNWHYALRIARQVDVPNADSLKISSTAFVLAADPKNKYKPKNLLKLIGQDGTCALPTEDIPLEDHPALPAPQPVAV